MSNIADRIPEIPLEMRPLTAEAQKFIGFEYTTHIPNHKIGGSPDWIHEENEIPDCSSCFIKMTFIAQIDSVGDGLCFGDVGMLYIFMCRECGETKTELDCG